MFFFQILGLKNLKITEVQGFFTVVMGQLRGDTKSKKRGAVVVTLESGYVDDDEFHTS